MLLMLSLFFMNISTSAQKIAVKSNLLYDASSSLNIGTEFKLVTQTILASQRITTYGHFPVIRKCIRVGCLEEDRRTTHEMVSVR